MTTSTIIRLCASAFNVKTADVLGPRRTDAIASARHAAMALIRAKFPKLSYGEIGRLFNRDHGTVMYAVERMNSLVADSPEHRALSLLRHEVGAAQAVSRELIGKTILCRILNNSTDKLLETGVQAVSNNGRYVKLCEAGWQDIGDVEVLDILVV